MKATGRFLERQPLNIPVAWNTVWLSLRLWRFVRSVQDTAWLSFHGILPTADRLVRFGMKVNPACFCGETESLLHLFTLCPFVLDIFNWFKVQYHKYDPAATLTAAQILFGLPSNVPIVFTALLGVLRHHVWLARNKHRFEHVSPDLQLTIKNAKSTFRILQDSFERDWLVRGIIGTISESGHIEFGRDFVT